MKTTKPKIGARIRIKQGCGQEPYFSSNDCGTVDGYGYEDNDLVVRFDDAYGEGVWYVNTTDCEVIENADHLTNQEYYAQFGTLTKERIEGLLALEAGQRNEPEETGFKDLVERVRRIDPAAAEYLDGYDIKNCECNFHEDHSLDCVMMWDETPQGHGYWSDISRKLQGVIK